MRVIELLFKYLDWRRPSSTKHLHNIVQLRATRHCTNVIQMFCVCWAWSKAMKCELLILIRSSLSARHAALVKTFRDTLLSDSPNLALRAEHCSAKPKGSMYLLVIQADTAFDCAVIDPRQTLDVGPVSDTPTLSLLGLLIYSCKLTTHQIYWYRHWIKVKTALFVINNIHIYR